MRKFVVTIMASLLSCSTAFAFWPEAADSSLEIGVGYRQDRLEWRTKADSDSYSYDNYCGLPGLSSRLKWRNLNIWQIEAIGKYVTCDNVYLRANGDFGWITSGKNTDSDFIGDSYSSGSDFEFAHSRSKARGHVYDAKIAAGYQFKLCDDTFTISPLVGYSWHGQHIKDRHLKQDFYVYDGYTTETIVVENNNSDSSSSSYSSSYDYFDTLSSSSYSYGGNHSKYHTRWNGPFVGFDFEYFFGCGCELDWQIFGGYEFHWAQYHAKADWNLRHDLFDGFHHRAKNAYGNVFDIGIKWDFCECWTLALKGEFQWWWADKGHDRAKIFEANCGDVKTDCFVKIPLRHVRWDSAAVSLDIGMVF